MTETETRQLAVIRVLALAGGILWAWAAAHHPAIKDLTPFEHFVVGALPAGVVASPLVAAAMDAFRRGESTSPAGGGAGPEAAAGTPGGAPAAAEPAEGNWATDEPAPASTRDDS